MNELHDMLWRAKRLRARVKWKLHLVSFLSSWPHYGLCDNLGIVYTEPNLRKKILKHWEDWPRHSGLTHYPVKGNKKKEHPESAFHRTKNLYKGNYGKDRLDLLDYTIEYLEKEIKIHEH